MPTVTVDKILVGALAFKQHATMASTASKTLISLHTDAIARHKYLLLQPLLSALDPFLSFSPDCWFQPQANVRRKK